MQKKYYPLIDYIKLFCALLVVGIHTGPFLSVDETLNFAYTQILGRMAVPFFFIASSYFFFKKIQLCDSVKEQNKVLKQYIWRIARLYFIWSLIYFVFVLYGWISDGFTIVSLLRYIRNFFFTGSYYHLWFLPAMIVSVYMVFFLKDRMHCKNMILLATAFYLIGMTVNVYGDLLVDIPVISTIVKGYLSVFETTRNGVFFGFIYTVIGYLLAKSKHLFTKQASLSLFVFFFICFIVEACLLKQAGIMNNLTSMYGMLVPLEFFLFSYLLYFPSTSSSSVVVREMSTLIYVIHIIFSTLLSYIPMIAGHSFVYYIAVCFVSVFASYVIIKMSKNIPVVRKLYR